MNTPPEGQSEPSTPARSRALIGACRALLLALGLALLAGAWLVLAPERWLGRLIPVGTAGTAFNLSLLAEVRLSLALLGLLLLGIALLGERMLALGDRLARPLAAADRWLRPGRRWSLCVLFLALVAALLLAAFSIIRHNHFNSKAYDLGLHAQVFWNTSQGRPFAGSVEVDNYLGDHVSPVILLLAPLYRLWPDPRLLLVLQALALATGALPLAWLARRLLSTPPDNLVTPVTLSCARARGAIPSASLRTDLNGDERLSSHAERVCHASSPAEGAPSIGGYTFEHATPVEASRGPCVIETPAPAPECSAGAGVLRLAVLARMYAGVLSATFALARLAVRPAQHDIMREFIGSDSATQLTGPGPASEESPSPRLRAAALAGLLTVPAADHAYLTSLLLALIYLTYPALSFVNRFEFHEEVLAVPLLLLAFWWLETDRPLLMSLALFLALLCKEDVGLTVAAFGLWTWYRRRQFKRVGLAWTAVGLAWSLAALFVVIPAMRGARSDTLSRYAWLGGSTADILDTLLSNPRLLLRHLLGDPRRLWFLVKFLLPVGFLPLLSPAILVALPALAVNWLAGNLYQASIYFHYAALLIPIIFAAAAYGLARATTRDSHTRTPAHPHTRTLAILLLWLILCAGLALAFDQPWQQDVGPDDWENYGLAWQVRPESVSAFREAAALLPADAAVATTEAYAPHLANRQGLYLLYDPRILRVADRVEWVLVDLNDQRYGVNPRFYYGLLRWIADRQGLRACYFSSDVVLLGPGCADPSAAAWYRSRLADLQRSTSAIHLEPALMETIGPQYFVPQSGQR